MSASLRCVVALTLALGAVPCAGRADEPKYPHVNTSRTWAVDSAIGSALTRRRSSLE